MEKFHKIQELHHYSGFRANLAVLDDLACLVYPAAPASLKRSSSGAVSHYQERSKALYLVEIQQSTSATRVSTAITAS